MSTVNADLPPLTTTMQASEPQVTAREAKLIQRLRSLADDGIILIAVTKVSGKIINLAVLSEGKREAV